MSDYPPPPGDGERPLDPQYAYPQYPVFAEPGAPHTSPPTTPPATPPRKNRTGVVVAVAAAVVVGIVAIVLALVAVTGTDTQRTDLALPIPTNTSPTNNSPTNPGTAAPPTAVAPDPGTNIPSDPAGGNEAAAALAATEAGIQYFSALQTQDPDELSALLCRGTPATHTDDLADIVDAEPTDRAYVTGSQATMAGEILLDDGTGYGIGLTLAAAGSAQTATGWCVQREARR